MSLRRHLLELLDGGHAHPDFEAAIAGLPAELRGAKPPGLPHTPWRLLEHMRIAQWDILRFSVDPDHVSPEFPAGYWPDGDAPPDPAAWDRSVEAFRADLQAMKDLVADPQTDLFAPDPARPGADDPPRGPARGRPQCLPHRPDDRGPPAPRRLGSGLSRAVGSA